MVNIATAARWACAWPLLGACELQNALDVVGVDQTVIETRERETFSPEPPTFDQDLSIVEEFSGCRMRVNKSAAITHLTLKDFEADARADFDGVVLPTRNQALAALGARTVLPSMEVVNGALKPWNDGLYAAIERIAEDGSAGSLVNKRETFDALLATLLERSAAGDRHASSAAADFRAAQLLSPGNPARASAPQEIEAEAVRAIDGFRHPILTLRPVRRTVNSHSAHLHPRVRTRMCNSSSSAHLLTILQ
jgi:hypothetical protein